MKQIFALMFLATSFSSFAGIKDYVYGSMIVNKKLELAQIIEKDGGNLIIADSSLIMPEDCYEGSYLVMTNFLTYEKSITAYECTKSLSAHLAEVQRDNFCAQVMGVMFSHAISEKRETTDSCTAGVYEELGFVRITVAINQSY